MSKSEGNDMIPVVFRCDAKKWDLLDTLAKSDPKYRNRSEVLRDLVDSYINKQKLGKTHTAEIAEGSE